MASAACCTGLPARRSTCHERRDLSVADAQSAWKSGYHRLLGRLLYWRARGHPAAVWRLLRGGGWRSDRRHRHGDGRLSSGLPARRAGFSADRRRHRCGGNAVSFQRMDDPRGRPSGGHVWRHMGCRLPQRSRLRAVGAGGDCPLHRGAAYIASVPPDAPA
ncbi:hypothetical protein D3C80_1202000 [compost metagenome]